MRKKLLLLFLMAIMIYSKNLSKSDLLGLAFENSEELKQIDQDRKVTQSMKKEYFGKAFPTITGNLYYQHNIASYNPYDFGLDGGSQGTVTDAITNGGATDPIDYILAGATDNMISSISSIDLSPLKNTLSMGISITQPIFAQGKVSTGLKMAKIYAETIEYKYQDTKFKLAKDIINSYNGSLVALENINIRKDGVSLAQESHRLAVARFKIGKGTELDTLNTRFEVVKEESLLRAAKKDYRLAVKNMFTIASINEVVDSVTLVDSLTDNKFAITYNEALTKMLENNRTLKQLDGAIKLQKLNTFLKTSDFFPTVFAGADFSAVTQYNGVSDADLTPNHKVFAGVTVPLFEGMQKFHRVNQEKFKEDKIEQQKQAVIDKLTLGLIASYEELNVARKLALESKEMVALTSKGYSVATVAYNIGQITQLDLTDSKQNSNLAKLSLNNSLRKINQAITAIRQLIADPSLIEE